MLNEVVNKSIYLKIAFSSRRFSLFTIMISLLISVRVMKQINFRKVATKYSEAAGGHNMIM